MKKDKGKRATVYVLMRLYCRDVNSHDEFLAQLGPTLDSVVANKKGYGGRLVLMVCDDTRQEAGGPCDSYKQKRNALLASKLGKGGEEWMLCESRGKGSSYAMFELRDFFLQTAKEENDIAVLLDQDDELRPDAVSNIASQMKPRGIVISPFQMRNEEGLDITDDGGEIHNAIARRLNCRLYATLFSKGLCKRSASDLSSIGWTKSYTRSAMQRYQFDLKTFLEDKRGGADSFFSVHRAYEDFIDYYVLLQKDIPVTGIREDTHIYIKHKDSITSTPTVDDFREHRPAMLQALIDLCYAQSRKAESRLYEDYRSRLLRYVASKACQIDSILKKYSDIYEHEGSEQYAHLAEMAKSEGFVMMFIRHINDDVDPESMRNLKDLTSPSSYKHVRFYSHKLTDASPSNVLQQAAAIEARRRIQAVG